MGDDGMSEDLSHWLLQETYTVAETALLLAGIEPFSVKRSVEKAIEMDHSRAYKALSFQKALAREIKTEEGFFHRASVVYFGSEERDLAQIKVPRYLELCRGAAMLNDPTRTPTVESLGVSLSVELTRLYKDDVIKWANHKMLTFPYGCSNDSPGTKQDAIPQLARLFDADNPYVSGKMRAAITVLCELMEKGTGKRTPKMAALEMLKEKYSDIGDLEEVAKVISWHTTGGSKQFPPLDEYLKQKSEK